jgi:hypothetical protein
LVGRSAPELVLADGTRLAEQLHGGAGVLVGAARVTGDRLRAVAGDGPEMLIRPDGIVAWVADDGDLDAALRRWFGDVRVEIGATVS